MFNINTGLSKLPKQVLSLFEQNRGFKKKSFSVLSFFITVFSAILCLPNTALTGQCVTIPVSPVTISGQPYISTFSNINLNGSGSTAATALPGSSVSISFDQVMNFSGQYCPGCVTFHQVGVGGTTTAISCLQGRRPSRSQNFNTTFTAPNTPGVYYITMYNTLDYQCNTINYSNDPSAALAVIVVKDVTPPTISCPANIIKNADQGVCSASVSFSPATATDDCSATVSQTGGLASGSTFSVGTSTITYTATDPSNNTSNCSFTVTVKDNEAPKITCPDNISVSTDPGVCGAAVTFSAATATDNCSATVTQTTSYTSGQTFPVGTTTITYSAKDPSNNTVSCSFNVVVTDNEAPKITCPANISVNTDPGVCGAKVQFSAATATDNCSATVTQTTSYTSGQIFPVGTTTITYSAKDPSNNTVSCSFNVVVTDNEAPKITCPANISVNTDPGVCGAKVQFSAATATDNCSATVTQTTSYTSGQTFPVGTTTISYSAKDPSNNTVSCSFNVVVKDNEAPKVKCPSDISVNTDPGVCGAKVNFTVSATDNCSFTANLTGLASGSTFPVGKTTDIFKATDASGNTSSCTFMVTIKDNEAPKITCPASITKSSDVGICGAKYSFSTPVATDNCSAIVTQTGLASGSTFPVGVNTVTFTATDPSGNTTSCSFTVTVNSLASFDPNVCYNILNNGLPIVLEGDNAQLYSTKQTKVQSFKFIALPNGNIQILSSSDKNAKKSLSDEAPKGDLKAKLKDYKSDDLQSDWQINCVNGSYVITHKGSGLVLTVGATANDGKIPVVVAASNGGSNQSWTFQAVTCPAPDNDLLSKNVSNLKGYAELQRNVIDFTTNQGLNTDYYTAEKLSRSSGNFEVLELRDNTELTDKLKFMTFYDNAPYEGDNFYRVKSTFLDGTSAYTNVQQINTKVAADFSIFPNPTDEEAWLDLKAFAGKQVTLTVSDLAGKTLQLEVIKEAPITPHHLDLSGYTTGLYFIKVQTAGKRDVVSKLQIAK